VSTIIIITPPTKPQRFGDAEQQADTTIKVKLDGTGSISDQLREAAAILEGTSS
jgi:hypothetical protein